MSISLPSRFSIIPTSFLLALLPNLAFAHVGAGATHGFAHGAFHPFMGLDHLLAMVAVGLWATQLGGKAVWFVPLTFVSVMALGGLLGMAGIPLPFVELGILSSLLIFGLLIATAARLPLIASSGLVALFAVFHGFAHGAEMPQNASGLNYAMGFILATVTLHIVGIVVGNSLKSTQWLRWIGASIALFGSALYFAG
ncbi:MAG: HupE/UreJ family protein [Gallionellaceae bacterium]